MRYKLCKFRENRARDTPLRGVYIPDFGQIWVKNSILGVLHPCRCTDGGEIWHGGGDLRGEKPQNRHLSKRNTGRFALRAMLPVITAKFCDNNLTWTCSCTVHEAGKFDSKKMLTCVAMQQKYHFVHHSAIECVLYYHKTLLQSAVVINAIVIMCIWLSHSCTIRKWRMYDQTFHHLVTQSF